MVDEDIVLSPVRPRALDSELDSGGATCSNEEHPLEAADAMDATSSIPHSATTPMEPLTTPRHQRLRLEAEALAPRQEGRHQRRTKLPLPRDDFNRNQRE